MALKACTVVIHDLSETAHAIDVTAESMYEAIAQALATLRGHDWVGEYAFKSNISISLEPYQKVIDHNPAEKLGKFTKTEKP